MMQLLTLLIYRALLPLLFLFAFPGWIVKMIRRGGFRTALNERLGIYLTATDFEPSGAIHIHSVSVGETVLALKLLREWSTAHPGTRFVLATGTSTGHDLAVKAGVPGLRVTYSPLDFPWMLRRYLNRFEPAQIVLIEGEVWPNLLRLTEKRGIPVSLANARVSPRSSRRFLKFAPVLRPFFSKLSAVCIQETEHRELWQKLGVPPEKIHLTGSIKFDPLSTSPPSPRPDFAAMLAAFGPARPLILAASTFPGEEALVANAIHAADPTALPLIVPRHAERRAEVAQSLAKAGFTVTLRSTSQEPVPGARQVLVIDTTGELAIWTAHADVVIIGKSFLSTGGQNPAEAILAHKPLILGPHMENFQPLVHHLREAAAVLSASDSATLAAAIPQALDPATAARLAENAYRVLCLHQGATQRHLSVLHRHPEPA
jgi:3-deoxy-D-manno-octulosonic-acid transferase